MKIAICASEGAPYAKSGGLGDVMEALPSALARIAGNEVVLFLPYYHKIKTNTAYMVERVAEIRVQLGWRQQYCGIMKACRSISLTMIITSVPAPARFTGTWTTASASPSSPGAVWTP